jgi:hypothetical protein
VTAVEATIAPRRWRLSPAWRLALWLVVVQRVGLEVVALASLRLVPIGATNGDWTELWRRDVGWPGELLTVWQRWDALWYERIARDWYRPGDNTVHFEPLLGRLLSPLLGGDALLGLLAASTAAFAVAMWLLYRVARLDDGARVARLTVLLVALSPDGFFLLAPYTESLYLALTLATFWLARRGHPWLAGLAGLGAGATRTVGAFLVMPLAYEALRRRRAGDLLAATLPGWGLVGATLYLRVVVGDHRTMLEVAERWEDRLSTPWDALAASRAFVVRTGGDPPELVNLVTLLGMAALGIGVARRRPLVDTLYVWPYLLLLCCRQSGASPVESVARYALMLFPCYIVLARRLARRPWLLAALLALGLMLQTLLFQRWVHFGFVG